MLDIILGIFYLTPIVLITNKWYKWMYGDYTLKWDIQYCIDNFINMKTVWCFVFFGLLTMTCLIVEYLLSNILFIFSKKIDTSNGILENADRYISNTARMSLKNIYKSVTFNQIKEFQNDIIGFVVIVSLWCIFIGKWYLYPLIPISIFIAYITTSILESNFRDFNEENIENPPK